MSSVITKIVAHYKQASFLDRWHLRARLRLCPYDALLRFFPERGNLLDVGCGFGHLAWYLAETRPAIQYFGLDPDPRKIQIAQKSLSSENKIQPHFQTLLGEKTPAWPDPWDCIVLLDVLYLIPWEQQLSLLNWAFERISVIPQGSLILKGMESPHGFSGWRALAEEWIMVHLLQKTLSSGTLRGAQPVEVYQKIGAEHGFQWDMERLPTFNPSFILRFHR